MTNDGTITVAAKSGAPSPADPTDTDSGLTFTLGGDGPNSTLTYAQGQLIDSPGGAVALNGSFGYTGTFTGKKDDTTVIAIFTGTMLNKQVLAIPIKPDSGWSKFWKGITFQKLITYFLTAMGVWIIDFLKQKLTGKDNKAADDQANENEGGDLDPQQQAEAQQAGDDIGQQAADGDQQLADNAAGGQGQVDVPQDQAAFDQAVDGHARTAPTPSTTSPTTTSRGPSATPRSSSTTSPRSR